jgi:hypothetical protein
MSYRTVRYRLTRDFSVHVRNKDLVFGCERALDRMLLQLNVYFNDLFGDLRMSCRCEWDPQLADLHMSLPDETVKIVLHMVPILR